MALGKCTICASENMESLVEFRTSVSSDSHPVNSGVINSLCGCCGAVLNIAGTRGNEAAFYAEKYKLLADSAAAEFTYAVDLSANARGVNDEMIDFLISRLELPATGRLLEVGCGKGVFLSKFQQRFAGWSLSAVEPSANAQRHLQTLVPGARVHQGTFETCPFLDEDFDLVVSVGVLEHVPQPVTFVRQLIRCVGDSGHLFLSVPNFRRNPTDLLVYDHLTRFTPATLHGAITRAGATVVDFHSDDRVPMWALISVKETGPGLSVDVNDERLYADRAVGWLRDAIETYRNLGKSLDERSGRLGIYGTGVLAFAVLDLAAFPWDRVICFFDDNAHLQGSSRLGKPVKSLSQWRDAGITDLCFSANPCYLGKMNSRVVSAVGGQLKIWSLPPSI